jgi:hypothetical protein
MTVRALLSASACFRKRLDEVVAIAVSVLTRVTSS